MSWKAEDKCPEKAGKFFSKVIMIKDNIVHKILEIKRTA
jgi:hypothetical protein